jgi:rare lipoprotein A
MALTLAACGTGPAPEPPSTATAAGSYKVGKPYEVGGRWYYPKVDPSYDRIGTASWYGADFHGLKTANGEVFDMDGISAAHPTLPLPSLVRVTNMENGRSLVLRVNDRGPFVEDRLIDLSQAAARELGYERDGLAKVRVQFVQIADGRGPAPSVAPPRPPGAPVAPPEPPTVVAVSSRPVDTAPTLVRVAAAEIPPVSPVISLPSCDSGGWVVQVGAFADAASVRALAGRVSHLERVRVEPAFIGDHAVARVRLGPIARERAAVLLGEVKALGYDEAFVACGTRGAGFGVS